MISPWYQPIAVFFREIERQFAREWKRYADVEAPKCEWPVGVPPELWKGVGDEVIYTKEITDTRETICVIQCWIKAISTCREVLRKQHKPLDIKASAWIAGFPVRNAEIIFPTQLNFDEQTARNGDSLEISVFRISEYYGGNRAGYTRDFVGPSIDIGFRISSLATSRKMTLSIDLALMLAVARLDQPNSTDMGIPRFHYDGKHDLKGLTEPYPVFWLDMDIRQGDADLEHGLRKEVGAEDVKRFADQFIAESAFHTRPYIVDVGEKYFGTMPPDHSEWLARIKKYLAGERTRSEEAAASMRQPIAGDGLTEPELDKIVSGLLRPSAAQYRRSLGFDIDDQD